MTLTLASHDSDPIGYHIKNDTFEDPPDNPKWKCTKLACDKADGLEVPRRHFMEDDKRTLDLCRDGGGDSINTVCSPGLSLQITNLDHRDPIGYEENKVPRSQRFIESEESVDDKNVFNLTDEPAMPPIAVECEALGFDLGVYPIYWRLECQHVCCRFLPIGGFRYWGYCRKFKDEWQGRSSSATFTLFVKATVPGLLYDFNKPEEGRVLGGHAILTVAAWPPGSPAPLLDFVHLRIGGKDPSQEQIENFIDEKLEDYDSNIRVIAKYLTEHESGKKGAFVEKAQRSTKMRFNKARYKAHSGADDAVVFNFPPDPPDFPYVSFDWGVGLMQYNQLRGRNVEGKHAWNWRESLIRGINEMLEGMRIEHPKKKHDDTWKTWGPKALKHYNNRYLKVFKAGGKRFDQLTNDLVPDSLKLDLLASPPVPPPPAWPPKELQSPPA